MAVVLVPRPLCADESHRLVLWFASAVRTSQLQRGWPSFHLLKPFHTPEGPDLSQIDHDRRANTRLEKARHFIAIPIGGVCTAGSKSWSTAALGSLMCAARMIVMSGISAGSVNDGQGSWTGTSPVPLRSGTTIALVGADGKTVCHGTVAAEA